MTRMLSVTLRAHGKVLLHVCSYDFYDMTLSTEYQRPHMTKSFIKHSAQVQVVIYWSTGIYIYALCSLVYEFAILWTTHMQFIYQFTTVKSQDVDLI